MFIERAFLNRTTLSDRDLERLRAALVDEADRYAHAIRNYPADRLEKYGRPFLAELRQKIVEVDATIAARSTES